MSAGAESLIKLVEITPLGHPACVESAGNSCSVGKPTLRERQDHDDGRFS